MSVAAFETAWRQAQDIPGWLSEEEARHLYAAALRVDDGECVVEIGTYRGKSTVLLAHSGKPIITIDPMYVGIDHDNRMDITAQDVAQLKRTLDEFPNVTWVNCKSTECPLPEGEIGLLYIDGNHQFPYPLADFKHFSLKLSHSSHIAFQDYRQFDGVTRTVDQLLESGALLAPNTSGSMCIARASSQRVETLADEAEVDQIARTNVTGFHLFVLCHRFGMRGRAFANSVSSQDNNPYHLHVTAFYCEPEDAHLIAEGTAAGNSPVELTFTHIPEHRVMQRALHFHQAKYDQDCSHVVFTDCDLWFPPSFFADYGKALEHESPGYWSTCVMNIPQDSCDRFLEEWDSLSEECLADAAEGVRHDGFNGTVGHFQCVPAQLVRYAEDQICAVNRADEVFSKTAIAASDDKRRDRRIGPCPLYHFDHHSCWTGTNVRL